MSTQLLALACTFLLQNAGGSPDLPLSPASANFRVENNLTIHAPAGARLLRAWLPLPRLDPEQSVAELTVEAPEGWRETKDALDNRFLYVEVREPRGDVAIRTSFALGRKEVRSQIDASKARPLGAEERERFAAELAPNANIVIDDEIRALAARVRGEEQNPLLVARKLYDWVLGNVEYWVKDPSRWSASPVGSSSYCLSKGTGNCTDFHSLWTALARASGIPTRMKYGSLFKPTLDGADRDASYHCWPEFWVSGLGWIPHDVALADIFDGPIALDASNQEKVILTTAAGYEGPNRRWVDYYFGNLDARRVTWSMGRDLWLEPRQDGGPVNAIPKGYVELDGKEFTSWERKMTYHQLP